MPQQQEVTLVGKIGSMALIRREDNDIDYNIFSRLGAHLQPGMVWVSSGATEIGRLDYMKRNHGRVIDTDDEESAKTDYSAQGQAILMENYRRFISPMYSVRQLLVEHMHFNDPVKRENIRTFLLRCTQQGAIPIVNYNDPVSVEENRRMELSSLRRQHNGVVECVDNDETAAVVATLLRARTLLILTSVEGIYAEADDPTTLVQNITGSDAHEVVARMADLQAACIGASRKGAGGAWAKLQFMKAPVLAGTRVIIGHARHPIDALLAGDVPCTRIGVGL